MQAKTCPIRTIHPNHGSGKVFMYFVSQFTAGSVNWEEIISILRLFSAAGNTRRNKAKETQETHAPVC